MRLYQNLPSLRRIFQSTTVLNRGFHQSSVYLNKPDVFKNSLYKTLEAHRTSNRASLVRKVINTTEPPGIFRPDIPEKNFAGYEPPKELSLNLPQDVVKPSKARRHRKIPVQTKDANDSLNKKIQLAGVSRGIPKQHPWLKLLADNDIPPDGPSRLDAEIRAFETYLAPTPQEQTKVEQLVAETNNILKDVVSQAQVIGSRRTGFASSHSGLDFALLVQDTERSIDDIRKPSATRPKALAKYNQILRNVEQTLRQNPQFSHQVTFSNKRNPVVTAVHQPTNLHLQFYCAQELPASIEYLSDYQAEYPAIRSLYMPLRVILETHGLFGAHTSGIRADALLMLITTFCKMNHGRFQRSSLGNQLLSFLHTYGTAVNLRTTGVAVDPPAFFDAQTIREESSKSKRGQDSDGILPAHLRGQRSLINAKRTAAKRNLATAGQLTIQDPANYMNDLGRSCTRTTELQDVFAAAHDRLKASLDGWEQSNNTQDSILAHALRANFDGFERIRASIMQTGD